ncbi:hypothetical protein H9X57_14045 [Flavobacterium piscinae]|uniref:Lipoprotein n=1 Tax=Flavobacterium piscinae TaxID=2506424 RepID=A0A4Q1KX68_9FLAO|nr:hypothetical protein [Flavobacterium piscinae]MBC8884047.1 hypothetical protein [Flavobacterium piscinae]RXR34842.1 hypothetical protein EQG68_02735 [Flavobacterium piscinae]
MKNLIMRFINPKCNLLIICTLLFFLSCQEKYINVEIIYPNEEISIETIQRECNNLKISSKTQFTNLPIIDFCEGFCKNENDQRLVEFKEINKELFIHKKLYSKHLVYTINSDQTVDRILYFYLKEKRTNPYYISNLILEELSKINSSYKPIKTESFKLRNQPKIISSLYLVDKVKNDTLIIGLKSPIIITQKLKLIE